MDSLFFTGLVLTLFIHEINFVESKNDNSILSRRKRYVAFPEGASMSFALCLTEALIATGQLFSQGVNWGMSYELPNATTYTERYIPELLKKRRHRRDLYNKVEIMMDAMGFDGRACIYRALCETPRRLFSNDNSLIEELLRIMFKFPLRRLMHSEPEEHRLYHRAYRIGHDSNKDCSDLFPACSFSLIDMALGAYSHELADISKGSY